MRPHGGRLVNRVAVGRHRERLLRDAEEIPWVDLDLSLAMDAENIGVGLYSPLEGFMGQADLESVVRDARLSSDLPWGLPIILPSKARFREGDDVALRFDGTTVGVMTIEETYRVDWGEICRSVYGTMDQGHPGVSAAMKKPSSIIAGRIELLNRVPVEYHEYALTPAETWVLFKERGWKTVAGFQTRNAPHLGHESAIRLALELVDGVYINPVLGPKKPGDFPDKLVAETYRLLAQKYLPWNRVAVGFIKYSMRYAGPREALHHAIMRKNLGCTHFIVGRDHAGVGSYYKPYQAQEYLSKFPDLGINIIKVKEYWHCPKCGWIVSSRTCTHKEVEKISGTKIREALSKGVRPPNHWMRPEVADLIIEHLGGREALLSPK